MESPTPPRGQKKNERDPDKVCKFIKDDETQCGAFRLTGLEYCRVHDETTREQAIADLDNNRDKAAQSRKNNNARRKFIDDQKYSKPDPRILQRVPRIRNPEDLRAYLCELLPLAIDGELGGAREKLVIEFTRLIERTFEGESGAPPPPQLDEFDQGEGAREWNEYDDTGLKNVTVPNELPPDEELLGNLDLNDPPEEAQP